MIAVTPSRALRIICVAIFISTIFFAFTFNYQSEVSAFWRENVLVTGTVVDVEFSESYQKLIMSDLVIDNVSLQDSILIFSPLYPSFSYGDKISVRCILDKPEPYDGFRYDRYLASKNIYATCFVYSAPVSLGYGDVSLLKSLILKSRALLMNRLDKTFGEPHGSLLAGLLLGEQRFTDTWQERFLRTGTTHIVAASGYNISVVVWLMMGLLASFGIRRARAFSFLVAAVACYVILAGADAAVVRAGVMGVLVLFSRYLGRSSTMVNVLLVTAAVMLLQNPLIIFDVGFRLSMLSTVALVYIAPVLGKKLEFIPKAFLIRESIAATLSATFMALPVIVFSFKSFSLTSVFTNLLILPFIPYVMAFGSVAVIVSFVSLKIGAILSGPSWALLSVMLWVVKTISDLPLFVSTIPLLVSVTVSVVWIISIFFVWKFLTVKPFGLSQAWRFLLYF